MKDSSNNTNKLYISCEPGGMIFACFSGLCFALPWLPALRQEEFCGMIFALFYICGVVFLIGAVVWGKKYVFSDAGIEHRLLGICYRKTVWSDISSVMRLFTGAKNSEAKAFLITTQRGTIVHVPERKEAHGTTNQTPFDLCVTVRGFWHEWLCGKHFLVQCSKKQEEAVLLAIEKYYGTLTFDVT